MHFGYRQAIKWLREAKRIFRISKATFPNPHLRSGDTSIVKVRFRERKGHVQKQEEYYERQFKGKSHG
jgi:hypothetical protein